MSDEALTSRPNDRVENSVTELVQSTPSRRRTRAEMEEETKDSCSSSGKKMPPLPKREAKRRRIQERLDALVGTHCDDPCPLCKFDACPFFHFGPETDRAFYHCPNCELVFVPKSAHIDRKAEAKRYASHNNDSTDPRYHSFLQRATSPLLRVLQRASAPSTLDTPNAGNDHAQSTNTHGPNEMKFNTKFHDNYSPLVPDPSWLEDHNLNPPHYSPSSSSSSSASASLSPSPSPPYPILGQAGPLTGIDIGCGPGPTISIMLSPLGLNIVNYDPNFHPYPILPKECQHLCVCSSDHCQRRNNGAKDVNTDSHMAKSSDCTQILLSTTPQPYTLTIHTDTTFPLLPTDCNTMPTSKTASSAVTSTSNTTTSSCPTASPSSLMPLPPSTSSSSTSSSSISSNTSSTHAVSPPCALRLAYRFVTCTEVLEHIADPIPFISALYHLTAKGGVCVIMTGILEKNIKNINNKADNDSNSSNSSKQTTPLSSTNETSNTNNNEASSDTNNTIKVAKSNEGKLANLDHTELVEKKQFFATWHYHRDITHICYYSYKTLLFIENLFNWKLVRPHKDVAMFFKV